MGKKLAMIIPVILILVMVVSLFAVYGAKKETTTIVWSYWGDPWEIEINKKVAAKFEETHPNIKVEQQYAPWDSYFQKLETQWAGGTSPDVMFLTNVPSYAAKGVLENIRPLVKKYQYNLGDYYKEQLKLFEYGGKLYGVPRDTDTKVLFYNKTLFDEAKIPYPVKNLTWAQLVDTAAKLTKREGDRASQYGIAFDPGMWFVYIWMNGGQIFDNDANPTKTLVDEANAVEALQKVGDLINKQKCAPAYELMKDSSQIGQLFMTNKLAMVVGNHALVPTFLKASGLKWDITYLPIMGSHPKSNLGGGAGYCISAKSKHKEAAWQLWAFLTGEEGQKMFTESNLIVPANKKVLQSDLFLKQPFHAKVFATETRVGHSYPTTDKFGEFWTMASQYFEAIWTGQSSAKEAVNAAMPELTRIIKGK